MYLFNIRQREDESLKNFIGRFNNKMLEVQDLRLDMMVSILIHDLKKGSLASALAKDPPEDVEQLMRVAHKYIDEEEINAMKDREWQRLKGRDRGKEDRDRHARPEKEREHPNRSKFHKYTPLTTTRTKTLMMVEKSNLLQWPRQTKFTPVKKYSSKYCKFHRERGHDTEDCYQLNETERLVRQGYFKEYALEQEARMKDYKVGDRKTRSSSKNRGRFHGREREEGRNKKRENVSVKGVINTIAGGTAEGDSGRARKKHERA
ncbi:UNVERIFIED_CONTAM: hypothetical protein Sangu_2227900 [Sesamum angustifolium]|uniref:Retrotransposon gag domain-containing protein n=1 Tax=Sesamum angustifolium TaxID=2727405 RepID=A0AAW2L3L0_9LAMI